MCPLGLLTKGEKAEIIEVKKSYKSANPSSYQTFVRLDEMGIRCGKQIEMLNRGTGNSILIKIDNSRLAISQKIAMKIFVRRNS